MTRILPILLLLALCLRAESAHILFNLAEFVTGPISQRAFTLTPQSTPRTNTTSVITSDSFRYITTTLGTRTVSNMVDGVYKVDVAGPQTVTTFYIQVPDTNVLLNAKDLLTSTNSVPATIYGYTQSQADGRFVKIYNGFSSNQIATNMWFRGASGNATNLFVFTNSTPGRFLYNDGSNTFLKAISAGGGDVSDGANIGSGVGAFESKVGGVLRHKSFVGLTGIDVSTNADTVFITGTEAVTSISLSNTLFVATNGNDSTAVKGRLDLPWRSISNAVAAVANNQAIVIYPGHYIQNLNSNYVALELNTKTNVTISGVGQPIIWATNSPLGSLFKLTHCSDITIEGLRMEGPRERPGINGTSMAVEIAGGNGNPNLTFRNLDLIAWPRAGIIHLDGGTKGHDTNMVVTGCYFETIGSTNSPIGYDGAGVDGFGSYANIHHNLFVNCVRCIELHHNGNGPVYGVNISDNICLGTMGESILSIPGGQWDLTQGTLIERNIIWSWVTNQVNSVYWAGILVTAGKGMIINNNLIWGQNGGGIVISVSTALKQLSMSGNTILNGNMHGIYASGVGAAVLEDVLINFNNVNTVTNTGISIYGRNVDILNNHIYDASVANASQPAILVGDTTQATNRTTNVVIAINTIGNQGGPHIETGIRVESGAKSTKIFGNTIRVATTPIDDLDTTTASHDIVYSKNGIGRAQELHATNSLTFGTNASGAAQMRLESIPDAFGNGTNDARIYNNSDNTFGSILLGFPGSRLKVATDTFWQFRDNADTGWIDIGAETLTMPNLGTAEALPAAGHGKYVYSNSIAYILKSSGTMVNLEAAAGGGDDVFINDAAVTGINFTNDIALLPTNAVGMHWNASGSPARTVAWFFRNPNQFGGDAVRSNVLSILSGALVTNLFMYGTNKLDTSNNMTNAFTTAAGEWVLDWSGDEDRVITNSAFRFFARGHTNWLFGSTVPPLDGQVWKYVAAAKSILWTNDAGGAGTPGGSSSQVQYNSSGSFGGAVHVAVQNDRLVATNAHFTTLTNIGSYVYGENVIPSATVDGSKSHWHTNITGNQTFTITGLPLDHVTTVYVTNAGQHTVTWAGIVANCWVLNGGVEPKAITNGVSIYQFWRSTADSTFTNAVMIGGEVRIDFGSGTIATTNSQNLITVTVPGGAGGDSATVNGNAVLDFNLTNRVDIIPADAIGIDFVTNGNSSAQIVGYFGINPDHFAIVGPTNKFAIKNGALLTNILVKQELELPHVTASRVAIINSGNQVTNSASVDTTEIEFVDGATENLQALAAEKLHLVFTNGVNVGTGTNINWRNSDLAVGVEIRATNNPAGTLAFWPVLKDRRAYQPFYAGQMITNFIDPAIFTAYASSNTTRSSVLYLDYMAFSSANGTSNMVQFDWQSPPDWDAGTVRFKAEWWSTNLNTLRTNVLEFSGVAIGHNDPINNNSSPAFGTAVTITNKLEFGNTNQVSVQTAPITIGNSPAAGDGVTFKVRRLTENDNDIMEGPLNLRKVWLEYLKRGAEPVAWSP